MPLVDLAFAESEFEHLDQVDGTMARAIERRFGTAALKSATESARSMLNG